MGIDKKKESTELVKSPNDYNKSTKSDKFTAIAMIIEKILSESKYDCLYGMKTGKFVISHPENFIKIQEISRYFDEKHNSLHSVVNQLKAYGFDAEVHPGTKSIVCKYGVIDDTGDVEEQNQSNEETNGINKQKQSSSNEEGNDDAESVDGQQKQSD
eukprot:scaffold116626_cov36-Cyclotella_meneghiniana.AAC.1